MIAYLRMEVNEKTLMHIFTSHHFCFVCLYCVKFTFSTTHLVSVPSKVMLTSHRKFKITDFWMNLIGYCRDVHG